MAGIQALVDQATGSSQANPNPFYYFLARTEYGAGGNSSCNSAPQRRPIHAWARLRNPERNGRLCSIWSFSKTR